MRPFRSLSTVHYRWMAILWTAFIIIACSIPAVTLTPIQPGLGVDKIVHVGLFAIFGGLWMRVVCPPGRADAQTCLRRRGLAFIALGSLFAGGTELYQHVLPIHRFGDPYDALADGVGLFLGVGAYVLYALRRKGAHFGSQPP